LNITDSEKLILTMLAEIKQGLKLKGGVDAEFVEAAISYGYDWAFDLESFEIQTEKTPIPENVQEVMDILEMWAWLEADYDKLSAEDKALVKEVNQGKDVRFPGFDGHRDELSIANFLTNHLNGFGHFKGRVIPDSHGLGMDMDDYRRMLLAFERAREMYNPLKGTGIINTLLGTVEPSRR
jgi:uncharacterized protein